MEEFVANKENYVNELAKTVAVTENLEELQNEYFETLWDILTAPVMYSKIMQPLDMPDLTDVKNGMSAGKQYEIYHDTVFQQKEFISNRDAKKLVGPASLLLTFNSLLQRTKNIDLIINKKILGEKVYRPNAYIEIDGLELNTISGIGWSDFRGSPRTTSDNIIMIQSAFVDHANEKLVDSININQLTFPAYAALVLLKEKGKNPYKQKAVNTETIVQMVNNPIVRDYTRLMLNAKDDFAGDKKNIKQQVLDKLAKKYKFSGFNVNSLAESGFTSYTTEEFAEKIWNGKEYVENKNYNPREAIRLFLTLDEVGNEITQTLLALNADTNGAGSTMLAANDKGAKYELLLMDGTFFTNRKELLGTNGISQIAALTEATVEFTNDYLAPLFGYNKFIEIFDDLELVKGRPLTIDEKKKIANGYRSYVLSMSESNEISDINIRRQQLMIGDNSLAKRLTTMRYKYNEFHLFNKLQTRLSEKVNGTDYVVFETTDRELHREYLYRDFYHIANLTAGEYTQEQVDELQNFVKDLVDYSYVTGGIFGPFSFSQLIPPSLLRHHKHLRKVDAGLILYPNRFMRQVIQHNPGLLQSIDNVSIKDGVMALDVQKAQELEGVPQFISSYQDYKLKPFELIHEGYDGSLFYKELAVLGNRFSLEYDYQKDYPETIFIENGRKKDTIDTGLLGANLQIVRTENDTKGTSWIKKDLSATLKNLAKETIAEDQRILANVIDSVIGSTLIPVEVSATLSRYKLNSNSIDIRDNSTSVVEDILHEGTHAITVKTIQEMRLNPERFSEEMLEPFRKLESLLRETRTKLYTTQHYQALREFESVLAMDSNLRSAAYESIENKYGSEIYNTVYSTINIEEFVSRAMTNRDFQNVLNKIKTAKSKTFLTVLKELLTDFINALGRTLGIDIANNSVLYGVVANTFRLAEIYRPNSSSLASDQDFFNIAVSTSPNWYRKIIGQLQKTERQAKLTELDELKYKEQAKLIDRLKTHIEKLIREGSTFDGDFIGVVEQVANAQYDWIIGLSKQDKITSDEIHLANRLIDIWKDLINTVYTDQNQDVDDRLQAVAAKYDVLERNFRNENIKLLSRELKKRGLELETGDFGENLIDVTPWHHLTMGLHRNTNKLVQGISSLLREAGTKELTALDGINNRLKELDAYIKTNNVKINQLYDPATFRFHQIVKHDIYTEYSLIRKNRITRPQDYLDFVNNNLQVIDMNKHFTFKNLSAKLNENTLDELVLAFDPLNRQQSRDYILKKMKEQERHLNNYFSIALAKKEALGIGDDFDTEQPDLTDAEQEYADWVRARSPLRYSESVENGTMMERTFVSFIPKNAAINDSYFELVGNKASEYVLNEFQQIIKEVTAGLPVNIRNTMQPGYIPVIMQSFVKAAAQDVSILKDLPEKVKKSMKAMLDFSAPEYIKQNVSLEDTLRFVDQYENEEIIKNKNQSRDLINVVKQFAQVSLHYEYYNDVKPLVLLGQRLLENASTLERKYNGEPTNTRGNYNLERDGKGITRSIEMVNENIGLFMYLNRTKPDTPLWQNATPSFNDILNLINGEDKDGLSDEEKQELQKERDLVNLVAEETLKANKGFLGIEGSIAKLKRNNDEDFATTKTLIQYYLDKVNAVNETFRNSDNSDEALETRRAELSRWHSRLALMHTNTIYGSRIIDKLIKYRRWLAMAFNPISGLTNGLQAIIGGTIYANNGIDFDQKTYLSALGDVFKNWGTLAKDKKNNKMFAIAKLLQVDKDLLDLQGIAEGTDAWEKRVTDVAFKFMSSSEKLGRMSLVVAYLKYNKIGEKSLWDSFDDQGNFIGDSEEDWDKMSQNIIQLTLKVNRIADTIMGDTHSLKLLNLKSLGRAIGQFRISWMPEAFASRFEQESFDPSLQRNVKGRYLTYKDLGVFGSLKGVLQVWQSQFTKDPLYKKLKNKSGQTISEVDIENLRRNAAEAAFITFFFVMLAGLEWLADDEDDKTKKKWLFALINEGTLLQRDLTSFSYSTITDLVSGNLVPAYQTIDNFNKFVAKALNLVVDDSTEFSDVLLKFNKLIPGANLINKVSYMTERAIDD